MLNLDGLRTEDAEKLLALEAAVDRADHKGVGELLGREMPPDPFNALSRLQTSFRPALQQAIKAALQPDGSLSIEEVFLRAMARAVHHMKMDAVTRGEALGHLVPGIRTQYFQGGQRGLSPKDIETVHGFLDEAYAMNYPSWLRILKHDFDKEVEDPRVTYATIHKEDELVALAKSYPLTDDTSDGAPYFFGSNYVHRDFQGGYGFGSLVQVTALGQVPYHSPIYGHVAPDNPALSRHFRVNRAEGNTATLGVRLVREKDEEGESEELLETVVAGRLCGFGSVHAKPQEWDSWLEGVPNQSRLRGAQRIRVYSAEVLKGSALLACLRDNFADDFVLTGRTSNVWVFENRFMPLYGRVYWDERDVNRERAEGRDPYQLARLSDSEWGEWARRSNT